MYLADIIATTHDIHSVVTILRDAEQWNSDASGEVADATEMADSLVSLAEVWDTDELKTWFLGVGQWFPTNKTMSIMVAYGILPMAMDALKQKRVSIELLSPIIHLIVHSEHSMSLYDFVLQIVHEGAMTNNGDTIHDICCTLRCLLCESSNDDIWMDIIQGFVNHISLDDDRRVSVDIIHLFWQTGAYRSPHFVGIPFLACLHVACLVMEPTCVEMMNTMIRQDNYYARKARDVIESDIDNGLVRHYNKAALGILLEAIQSVHAHHPFDGSTMRLINDNPEWKRLQSRNAFTPSSHVVGSDGNTHSKNVLDNLIRSGNAHTWMVRNWSVIND